MYIMTLWENDTETMIWKSALPIMHDSICKWMMWFCGLAAVVAIIMYSNNNGTYTLCKSQDIEIEIFEIGKIKWFRNNIKKLI